MRELTFQNQPIRLIEKDGKQWAATADIAALALGYSCADSVTRLHDKYRVEYTESMTQIVETANPVFSGNLVTKSRVFSLRGAHLIGMFARTNKAQAIRRWVLNVLEQHQAGQSLIQQWFEAKAALDAQDRFASLCGRGLSEHRSRKPPLAIRVDELSEQIQPSLQLQ